MAQNHRSRFEFGSNRFDSSWELAVWIWSKDHNKEIIRQPVTLNYEYNGQSFTYYPDFSIDGQLVELKGPQFFDGSKMVNPYDRTQDDKYEAKHQCALDNNVQIWSSQEIQPILDYVSQTYSEDFLELFKTKFPYPKKCSTDNQVIKYFHKSLYHASKKGKLSPFEAWNDKSLILETALNRLYYIGKCTPESVLYGLSVAGIAPKVSVFKPNLAEDLIRKYLNEFNEIFDPFSGFSGRLIGSVNLGKHYYGQDINEDHIRESNEIIHFKNYQNCSVVQQDILSDSEQTHECLLTCPPYGGKEHWNDNETEKTCDEWIDICLEKYHCKKYLFVVDETEKYKDFVVETIRNHSHFADSNEYIVLI